ncbi:hypothetical protein ACFX13_018749 [Malus domestica]
MDLHPCQSRWISTPPLTSGPWALAVNRAAHRNAGSDNLLDRARELLGHGSVPHKVVDMTSSREMLLLCLKRRCSAREEAVTAGGRCVPSR